MRWVLVAGWLGAAAVSATAQADFLFDGGRMPSTPFDAGFVDLDGNGRLDLVVFSGFVGAVTVRYQQPDGSFEPELLVAKLAINHTVGNVVGDELPDLVFAKGTNKLSVVPTLGKGEFGVPIVTSGTGAMSLLKLADLDADGQLDLIGLDQLGDMVRILFGHPDGTFSVGPVITVTSTPFLPDAADLDGDGIAELLVVVDSFKAVMNAYPGLGSGAFGAPVPYVTGGSVGGRALADFDLDGFLDEAVSLTLPVDDSQRLRLLRGSALDTFTLKKEFTVGTALQTYVWSSTVGLGDVDEDGMVDLVVGWEHPPQTSAGFSLLRGLGGFNFDSPVKTVTVGHGGDTLLLDAGGNGHLDVVQIEAIGFSGLTVWPGDGTGAFDVPSYPSAPGPTRDIAAGDVNGDALTDVVAALDTPDSLAVWQGDGGGGLVEAPVTPGPGPTEQLDLADVDGDGDLDVAASEVTIGENLHVALNDGGGVFAWGPAIPVGAVSDVVLADVDGDGTTDAVCGIPILAAVAILPGDGHGGFGPMKLVFAGGPCDDVDVADVDEDGLPDIAAAVPDYDTVFVLKGSSQFAASTAWPASEKPKQLLAVDSDLDGITDIVTANHYSYGSYAVIDEIAMLHGLGAGAFAAPSTYGLPFDPRDLAAADVNRDGLVDIVAAGRDEVLADGLVGVYLGQALGTLAPVREFRVPQVARGLALADFDQNGYVDIATSSSDPERIGLMINQSSTWATLGQSLTSISGTPWLQGSGEPAPGQSITIAVSGAPSPSLGWLVVGLHAAFTPMKGGVLVPSADLALTFPPNIEVTTTWPPGLAPDTPIYLQAWFVASGEVAASNGLVVLAK